MIDSGQQHVPATAEAEELGQVQMKILKISRGRSRFPKWADVSHFF